MIGNTGMRMNKMTSREFFPTGVENRDGLFTGKTFSKVNFLKALRQAGDFKEKRIKSAKFHSN